MGWDLGVICFDDYDVLIITLKEVIIDAGWNEIDDKTTILTNVYAPESSSSLGERICSPCLLIHVKG